jgi:hypothetical protein
MQRSALALYPRLASRGMAMISCGRERRGPSAGWLQLGLSTGRTRQDRERTLQSPRKSVWVRPLHPAFRQQLTTPIGRPALLRRNSHPRV